MKYDFTSIIDRKGKDALAVDILPNMLGPGKKVEVREGLDYIPMWVADMDFKTAPAIIEALQKRVEHGVFGYSIIPDEWNEAYCEWSENRHHFHIEKDWLIFSTGVVPILSSVVRKLTTPGENVLIQTPVYNNFFNSIRNNGRNVVENELLYDGKEYRVDWEKLEQQLADPQTTLMILCNPQNPAGNIWDRETLARIGALCKQYDVIVV